MLERVFEKLLVQFLTPYVDGISRDKLHLGVFRGALELQDLTVKHDALYRLGWEDFSVRNGSIGLIKLSVPWSKIYTGKLMASIEDLHLEVESIGETLSNVAQNELIKQLRDAKRQAIELRVSQLIDLMEARRESDAADEGGAPPPGQKKGYVVKLVRKILHNITIKLHSVSLKFINKQRGLACGLEFPTLAVMSTDDTFRERDSKEEVLEAGTSLYKLMSLTDLSMSMSPAGIADMEQAAYVVSPISASLQLSHLPGEQTMRLRLEVATEQLAGITLRRSQVKHLRNIQHDIYDERQRLHSMLIPVEEERSIFEDAKASMAEYTRLFERHLLHEWKLADEADETLSDAEVQRLQLLEDAFSVRLLARARWQVRSKVGAVNEEVARRQREVEKKRLSQDPAKAGWLTRMRRRVWASQADSADSGEGGEIGAWLSPSEKEKLAMELDDETKVESVDLPQQLLFEFVLGQLSLDLQDDRFEDEVQRQLLNLEVKEANFMVGVHMCDDHRGQASAEWQVEVRLDGFKARHATTALFRFCAESELPSPNGESTSVLVNDDSHQAARLLIESRLEKEQNLLKLTFEFAPLEVHCLPGAVEQIIEFWRAPPRVNSTAGTAQAIEMPVETGDDRELQFEDVVHSTKEFFAARGQSPKKVAEQVYERIPDKMQLWINIASPIVHVPVSGLGAAMFSLGQLCVETPHPCAYSKVDLDINLQKTALRAISLRGERFDMVQPVPLQVNVHYRGSEDLNQVTVHAKVEDMVLSLAPQALQILISTPGAMASIMNPKQVNSPVQPQPKASARSRIDSKDSTATQTCRQSGAESEAGAPVGKDRASTMDRAAHFAQEVLGKDGTSMIDSVARKVEEVRRTQFRMNLTIDLNAVDVTFADSIVPVLRFRAEFPPPGFVMVQQTMPSFININVVKSSLEVETLNPRNGAWEPLAERVHYALTVTRQSTGDDSDGRATSVIVTGQEPLLLNFTPTALRRACWIIPLFVRSITFSLTDSDKDSIGKALDGTEVKYRVVNICEDPLHLRFVSNYTQNLEMNVEPTGSTWQSLDRYVLPHFVTGLAVRSECGPYSEQLSLDRVGAVAIPGTGYVAELLTPSPSHRLLLLSAPLRVHNNTDLTLRVRFHDAARREVLPCSLSPLTVCDAALLGRPLPDYKVVGQFEALSGQAASVQAGPSEIVLPKNYTCSVPCPALVRANASSIDNSHTYMSVMPVGLNVGWSTCFAAGGDSDEVVRLVCPNAVRKKTSASSSSSGVVTGGSLSSPESFGRPILDAAHLACETSTYIHALPAPTALTTIMLQPTLGLLNALPIGNLTVRFANVGPDFDPVGAWREARVPCFTRLSIYNFSAMLREGIALQAKLEDDVNWSQVITFGPNASKESDNIQIVKLRQKREGALAGIAVEPLNHIHLRLSCPNWFIDRSGMNKPLTLHLRREGFSFPNADGITLLPSDCQEEELDIVLHVKGRDMSVYNTRMPPAYSVFPWKTPTGAFVFCLQAEDIAPSDVLGAQCQVMILRARLVLTNASSCDIELKLDEDRSLRLHAGQSVDHHFVVKGEKGDKDDEAPAAQLRFRPYRNPPCEWSSIVECGDTAAGSTPFAISESSGKGGVSRGVGVEIWSVDVAPIRGAIAVSFRQGSDFVARNMVKKTKVTMQIRPCGNDDAGHNAGHIIVPKGTSVPYGWARPFVDRRRSVDVFINRARYFIDDVRRTQRKQINQHRVVLTMSRLGTQTLLTLQDYEMPAGGGSVRAGSVLDQKHANSSLQVEIKLGRLGVSIVQEIPLARELLYIQLDLVRMHWEKNDMDVQSLRLTISEAQVDCSLPGRVDAATPEDHRRVALLNSQERYAVILANCAEGDRSFLDIFIRRGATSSRDIVLPNVEVAFDAIDMTIDDGWLEPLVAWMSQCRSTDASTRGLTFENLKRMAGKSVLDNYTVPALPSVVQIDAMQIMPVNFTMWCSLKLRSVHFLPPYVKTALRVLALGGLFTLDGAALSLPQQKLNPHRGSLADFLRGLGNEYMINLLRNAAAMLGKSSFMNLPRMPFKVLGTAGAYGADSLGLFAGELSSLVNQLTFDDDYIHKQRQVRQAKKITNIGEGLVEASKSIVHGIEGFADVFRKPYEGGRKEGMTGFVTGVGYGLAGTMFKPWSNLAGAIADVGSGVAAQVTPDTIAMKRRRARVRNRLPRLLFTELGAIRPWDNLEAEVLNQLGSSLVSGVSEIVPLADNDRQRTVLLLFSRKLIVAEINMSGEPAGVMNMSGEPAGVEPSRVCPPMAGNSTAVSSSSSPSSPSTVLAVAHDPHPGPLDLFEALDESFQRMFSQFLKPINGLTNTIQDLEAHLPWKTLPGHEMLAHSKAREMLFKDLAGVDLRESGGEGGGLLLLHDRQENKHSIPLCSTPISPGVREALAAGFRSALVHADSIANWDALHMAIRSERRSHRVAVDMIAPSPARRRSTLARENGAGVRALEVFEVERRYPGEQDWRTPFMPTDRELGYRWVDATGTRHSHLARGLSREQVASRTSPPCELDAMFRPISEWKAEVDPNFTDSDGWKYSFAWNSSTWEAKPGMFDVIRRRKWRRVYS